MHAKRVKRPGLDENVEEEHAIEAMTQNITLSFHQCQRVIQSIARKSTYGTPQEKSLTKNIMASVARELQSLSSSFRKQQSSYLSKIRKREERRRPMMAGALFDGGGAGAGAGAGDFAAEDG